MYMYMYMFMFMFICICILFKGLSGHVSLRISRLRSVSRASSLRRPEGNLIQATTAQPVSLLSSDKDSGQGLIFNFAGVFHFYSSSNLCSFFFQ